MVHRPVDTLTTVSGLLPASVATLATSRWRSQSGDLRTTIVGKLTMQLAENDGASLVTPEPLISFDRIAADGRHVTEASELTLWTATACVVAYGGPLRFTIEDDSGKPILVVSSSAKSPAGYSMSSAERASFAKDKPSRGFDGLLTVPDGIDGRYFVAAPRLHQIRSITGNERFLLELTGFRSRRRLASTAVIATVMVGPRERTVALTTDMVVIHGAKRRISIVSRAVVFGDATLVSHAIVKTADLRVGDFGDMKFNENVEETSDLSHADLDQLRNSSVPFSVEPTSESQRSVKPLPATPFDTGFAEAAVVPASAATSTLTADQENARQLKLMRDRLRAEGVPFAPPAAPIAPPQAVPQGAQPPIHRSAAPTLPSEGVVRVAPPKPGAMAKPRFKPR